MVTRYPGIHEIEEMIANHPEGVTAAQLAREASEHCGGRGSFEYSMIKRAIERRLYILCRTGRACRRTGDITVYIVAAQEVSQ